MTGNKLCKPTQRSVTHQFHEIDTDLGPSPKYEWFLIEHLQRMWHASMEAKIEVPRDVRNPKGP